MSTDVAFSETTLFSFPSTVTSPGEDENLLVYYVSLLVPNPTPIPVKNLLLLRYTLSVKTP